MNRKIPAGAFEFYVALDRDRSYQAVAAHYGVSKRSVLKLAKRERWTERLEAIEREAQRRVDARLTEGIEEVRMRHTKMLRAMAGRAIKGLQDHPLTNGMEAIRAAESVIKLERILAGDPSERTADIIAEASRDEVRRLVTTRPESEDDWNFKTPDDAEPHPDREA